MVVMQAGLSGRMSFDEHRNRRFLPALDALRAISVLLVFTCHLHFGTWTWVGGEKGVTIFFILSGYLITSLALREERERGALNLTAFYVRRTFRILPLYYFVLAVYVLIILVLHAAPDKYANFRSALPYYLLYFQEYPFFAGINGQHDNIAFFHTWSLGIEEKFYLILPAIAFVFLRAQRPARLPTCIGLGILCIASPSIFGRPDGSMIFPYFNILCGCGLAFLLDNERVYTSVGALATQVSLSICAVLLLAFQFTWAAFKVFPYDYPLDVAYTLVATVFVSSVILNGARADRLLGFPILLLLGRLSYSMYLVHVLCLNAVETVIRKVAGFLPAKFVVPIVLASMDMLMVVVVTVLVSWILSALVEKPLIKIGRTVSVRILEKAGRLKPA